MHCNNANSVKYGSTVFYIPKDEIAMNRPHISVPLITQLLDAETTRHQNTINLIASENYADAATRAPLASIAGTKYAEGYPGKRYYAGCAVVDEIERAAQHALLDLFVPRDMQQSYHANVQPHAGSSANIAVYNALLQPGDTILSLSLAHGGHLTHGHAINLSGKTYTIISYGVDIETGLLCYDTIQELATRYRPRIIIAGATAYSRTIDFARFATIARSVNAYLLADIAHIAGLIAGGAHPSPVGHADIITSTTHKTLRGPRGAFILCRTELAQKIDTSIMPGTQGGPFMHAIAARAVGFLRAQEPGFSDYARTICATARALAAEMAVRGYHIVSGGTDNHLFLINLAKSSGLAELSGKQAEQRLEYAGIVLNRNAIPGDTRPPLTTSGIRIGLAAMVTRGMTPHDMPRLAEYIDTVLRQEVTPALQEEIRLFAQQFRLPA